MKKSGEIPPESKFLKQGWRSRDEQRMQRRPFRKREKQGLMELMREVVEKQEPTRWCHTALHIQHVWTAERIVEDEWFPDRQVFLSHCTSCNQLKYRYERKEEVQDCET